MNQVLLDALVHGFVRMNRLALLVFDEGTKFALKPRNILLANFQPITAMVTMRQIESCKSSIIHTRWKLPTRFRPYLV